MSLEADKSPRQAVPNTLVKNLDGQPCLFPSEPNLFWAQMKNKSFFYKIYLILSKQLVLFVQIDQRGVKLGI